MVRAYATCEGYQASDVAQGEYTLVEWVDEALLKQEMLEAAVRARKWRRRPGGLREIFNGLMRKAARVMDLFHAWDEVHAATPPRTATPLPTRSCTCAGTV